ncbi:MAG: hemerythrin domain-containing protein [Acidobacteriia bacterium]|nr:hemerythrin domain-containing protein [Terriglobia bacterium]
MATFPITFRSDSNRIHCDHRVLINELIELDGALDALGGDSGVLADRAPAAKVRRCSRHLAEALPDHFRHEEATVLDTVARVSPELAEFARQMRHEHDQLRRRLLEFCHAAQELEAGHDIAGSVEAVKESGKQLARDMTSHIALEEQQLDGFL